MIRTVSDISRDDRARIVTCSLLTPTDRLKENYSIDSTCWESSVTAIKLDVRFNLMSVFFCCVTKC